MFRLCLSMQSGSRGQVLHFTDHVQGTLTTHSRLCQQIQFRRGKTNLEYKYSYIRKALIYILHCANSQGSYRNKDIESSYNMSTFVHNFYHIIQ